ncbi:MAG: hypothetical protein WCD16_09065 [Paracoccaceae bacterium]
MALQSIRQKTAFSGAQARLDAFFAGIGQGFNAYLESRERKQEFEELYAKSDRQLADMGLTREGLARHVFRDLLSDDRRTS